MGSHKTISAAAGAVARIFDMLPKTGQTISYQDHDDGWYEKGGPPTPPRFTDLGNGTILDNVTGLRWVKDPIAAPGAPFNAAMTWSNAIINCEALNFAGKTDWRLPNVLELISIINFGAYDPPAYAVFFPNTQTTFYFSSSTWHSVTTNAWASDFETGLTRLRGKLSTFFVRPVRG